MAVCLLYAKIHKNKAENLLHLMLYFSAVQGIFVFVEKLHRIEYNITDDSGRRIWERGLYGKVYTVYSENG